MAYFVARELHIRPYEILTTWFCEELLVAYGEYANRLSIQNYESIPPKERATHKPKPITRMDRWAVPFISLEQMNEMSEEPEKPDIDIGSIANFLLQ